MNRRTKQSIALDFAGGVNSALELVDTTLLDVKADCVGEFLGEGQGQWEADVAEADDGKFHGWSLESKLYSVAFIVLNF